MQLNLSAPQCQQLPWTALLCTGLRHSGTEIICFISRQGDFFYVAVNTINLQQFHLRKHFLQKTQWLMVDLQALQWKDVFASVSTNSAAIPARERPLSLDGVSTTGPQGLGVSGLLVKAWHALLTDPASLKKVSSRAQCSDATVTRDFLQHTIPNSHWPQNLGGTNVFCNLPRISCNMCIPGIQQKWRQKGGHSSPPRLPWVLPRCAALSRARHSTAPTLLLSKWALIRNYWVLMKLQFLNLKESLWVLLKLSMKLHSNLKTRLLL